MSTFLTFYTLQRNLKSFSIHICNFLNYNVYYIPSFYISFQKCVCNSSIRRRQKCSKIQYFKLVIDNVVTLPQFE